MLTGQELGEFGDDVKAWQKAGLAFYRALQAGPAAEHPCLGAVRFTKAGKGKLSSTGADPLKWKMLPGLRSMIATADLKNTTRAEKRTDGLILFHWLENAVQVGERVYRVGIHVAEDVDGNKFYNLNQDLNAWERKYQAPGGAAPFNARNQGLGTPEGAQQFKAESQGSETPEGAQDHQLGAQGSREGESEDSTFDQSVAQESGGINLMTFEQAGGQPKGSITFGPDSVSITLLEQADKSTFIHETGHLWLNELIDDATTDGTPQQLKDDLDTLLKWFTLDVTAASGKEGTSPASSS